MRGLRVDTLRVNRRVLTVLLYALTIASIITAAFNVRAAWQTPFVLVALIFIISLLMPVEEIRTDVRYLRNVKEALTPTRTYATQQELYGDLDRAVTQANATLDLTHIRDQPPSAFGEEAGHYSEAVAAWLKQDNDHSVRRIISVRSPEMMVWARELRKLQERTPHYHIRVVDWSIGAPALNMAIVDGKAVFLALTGDTFERTRGFAIEDVTTAEYFSHYYSTLWAAAAELGDFLDKQMAG